MILLTNYEALVQIIVHRGVSLQVDMSIDE